MNLVLEVLIDLSLFLLLDDLVTPVYVAPFIKVFQFRSTLRVLYHLLDVVKYELGMCNHSVL